jgi:hypothetical protein
VDKTRWRMTRHLTGNRLEAYSTLGRLACRTGSGGKMVPARTNPNSSPQIRVICAICGLKFFWLLISRPLPISNLWKVLTVLIDVLLVSDQFVLELLFQVDALFADLGHTINHVDDKMEPVQVV